MAAPLKVLFVASELAPLVSTGGLADVVGALPKSLQAAGLDVRVAMPCYRRIPLEHRGIHRAMCIANLGAKTAYGAIRESRVPGTEIPLYLVEHEAYFGREAPYGSGSYEYSDNPERFSFFCLALLDGLPNVGWTPDVVHAHDWPAAALPAHLKTRFHSHPAWAKTKSVYTIHNLAYQGRYARQHYAATGLPWDLFHMDGFEFEGDMNLMKGGIAFADRLTTVSPRYAREIQTVDYGCGLHGLLQKRADELHGIINGIDYSVWHPKNDKMLPANYGLGDLTGKAHCRRVLLEELAIPDTGQPVMAMVSRLAWQKGIDLAVAALPEILEMGFSVVILGSGEEHLERRLHEIAAAFPEQLRVSLKFDVGLSHRIEAGADFFLMPSRYEPCGLSQIYSLAYATVPIVRATGGLWDTVRGLGPVGHTADSATGVRFVPMTPQAVVRAAKQSRALFDNKELLGQVRDNGMREDFSWARSSAAYAELYAEAAAA